jgi:ubiquinone/menaquinone biosynthesis C-methylase UbiE
MKHYLDVVSDRYDQEEEPASSIYAPTHPIGKYAREVMFRELTGCLSWYEKHYGSVREKTLLDVGCGDGGMLQFFTGYGFQPDHATGIDLSEKRIARAKQLYPDVQFVCADGIYFDLQPATFDLITTFDMLSHFQTKKEITDALQNMHRHLSEKGVLLWYDIYSKDHFSSPENVDSWGFSKQQMISLAKEAGFEPAYYRSCFKLFFNRYHSVYQVRRFPVWMVRLMEKILPGVPGNNLLVLKKSS